MPESIPQETATEVLNKLVSTSISLVVQLEAVLDDISSDKTPKNTAQQGALVTPPQVASQTPIDALSLARDSATLVRAHATKISLFIINEPFTPTAITKVLHELVAGPIPALASAAQLCDASRYTRMLRQELAWRGGRVLKDLKSLLEQIPKDGKVLSAEKKNGSSGKMADKGSLATTGLLWAACDDVIHLAKMGVSGYLVSKVEQFRDTLKDVLEELKEWGEETEDVEDGDENDGEDSNSNSGGGEVDKAAETLPNSHASTQAMLDSLMNPQGCIPLDDPNKIRERLDSCLRRLRLTAILYQAIVKRRLRILPSITPLPASNVTSRLDEVLPILKRMPELFSNLALAFYDLDPIEIDQLMDQCFFDAFAVSELLVRPWEGQGDEFTEWAIKFQAEIKKN